MRGSGYALGRGSGKERRRRRFPGRCRIQGELTVTFPYSLCGAVKESEPLLYCRLDVLVSRNRPMKPFSLGQPNAAIQSLLEGVHNQTDFNEARTRQAGQSHRRNRIFRKWEVVVGLSARGWHACPHVPSSPWASWRHAAKKHVRSLAGRANRRTAAILNP